MKAVTDEVRELLDTHDWNDTIPRLIKYALSRIRHMHWYQKKGGQVAAGKMAEDFVMEAIIKVYKGERRWDPHAFGDLQSYLFGVLRSEIGHQSQSLENRSVTFFEGLSATQQKKASRQNSSVYEKGGESEFLAGFIQFLKGENDLIEFVENIVAGLKPKEIAVQMKIPPRAIYNMRKVLRRRFETYLSQQENVNKDTKKVKKNEKRSE